MVKSNFFFSHIVFCTIKNYLKLLCEKEKMMVKSKFLLFSHCFLLYQKLSQFNPPLFFLIHNYFDLNKSEVLSFRRQLTLDKIFDFLKWKAFTDNKINSAQIMEFVLGCIANITGKGENAGNLHFLLFPQCFRKASFSGGVIHNSGLFGTGLTLPKQALVFACLKNKSFKNTGKRRN